MSKSKNEKPVITCKSCGKRFRASAKNHCPHCGFDIYTPVIKKETHLKMLFFIALLVLVFYLLFILFKEPIYYLLDRVPIDR
ncbi:MAG: hypothetical protein ACQESB_01095 [Elusimicrobiota bacterium]